MLGLIHLGIYAPIYENMKYELACYNGKFLAWHILISSMTAKGTFGYLIIIKSLF